MFLREGSGCFQAAMIDVTRNVTKRELGCFRVGYMSKESRGQPRHHPFFFMQHKIMVVDDEADVIDMLVINLRAAGFQVITVEDGATALAKARNERPR
jgi:PleD family two-component response regulator